MNVRVSHLQIVERLALCLVQKTMQRSPGGFEVLEMTLQDSTRKPIILLHHLYLQQGRQPRQQQWNSGMKYKTRNYGTATKIIIFLIQMDDIKITNRQSS